jgi:hypothetical protein
MCSRAGIVHPRGQARSRRASGVDVRITSPQLADIAQERWGDRVGPCVDGSWLARDFFTSAEFGRSSHVFGLLVRFT